MAHIQLQINLHNLPELSFKKHNRIYDSTIIFKNDNSANFYPRYLKIERKALPHLIHLKSCDAIFCAKFIKLLIPFNSFGSKATEPIAKTCSPHRHSWKLRCSSESLLKLVFFYVHKKHFFNRQLGLITILSISFQNISPRSFCMWKTSGICSV